MKLARILDWSGCVPGEAVSRFPPRTDGEKGMDHGHPVLFLFKDLIERPTKDAPLASWLDADIHHALNCLPEVGHFQGEGCQDEIVRGVEILFIGHLFPALMHRGETFSSSSTEGFENGAHLAF